MTLNIVTDKHRVFAVLVNGIIIIFKQSDLIGRPTRPDPTRPTSRTGPDSTLPDQSISGQSQFLYVQILDQTRPGPAGQIAFNKLLTVLV